MVFDRAIPPFIEANLAGAVDDMLRAIGPSRGDIDRLCCHPGGVKVIDAIETALELAAGRRSTSSARCFSDYGNMSAPTVLFVLERLIDRGLPQDAC